jgi:hypothetical protein
VQLDAARVTPPGATSPAEGRQRAPIEYGFAHASRPAAFPAGLRR